MAEATFDVAAERALLGAVLDGAGLLAVQALSTAGTRPEHFQEQAHQDVFAAMLSLADRAVGVDPVTVVAELERINRTVDPQTVHALPRASGSAGDVEAYGSRVRDLAAWRHRSAAAVKLRAAISDRDEGSYQEALAAAGEQARDQRNDSFGAEEWKDLVADFLLGGEGTPNWVVPIPFPRLSDDALAGGIWPGEVMIVSGHTSVGKSIFVDQCLDFAADHGLRSHVYMTEMTALMRGLRYVTRRTGIPFKKLRSRKLTAEEGSLAMTELGKLNYGCSIVSDWNIDEVVRHALRARYQLVAIDLIHGFPYETERELDGYSKACQRLARTSTTIDGHPGCAVIAAAHPREGAPKRLTIDWIKGSSSIKQDADLITLIHTSRDRFGAVTGDIEIAKGRSAGKLSQKIELNPRRFRFEAAVEQEEIPAEPMAF